MFKELDGVKTLQALPAEGMAAGIVGVVLEVFTQPTPAYLVEFSDADGEAIATSFLMPEQVELAWAFEPTRSRQA